MKFCIILIGVNAQHTNIKQNYCFRIINDRIFNCINYTKICIQIIQGRKESNKLKPCGKVIINLYTSTIYMSVLQARYTREAKSS